MRDGSLYQSEMLEDGNNHLLDGVGIPAVEVQEVKADRKGQRGRYAQHRFILKSRN
jgi:hypothetical protein